MLAGFIRNNKKSLYLLAFYFCLILLISFFWPRQIDWRPSYSYLHSKPYGAKILNLELNSLFPDAELLNSAKPIYNTVHDSIEFDGSSAYLFLNQSFIADSLELSRLLSFVAKGNTAFIAAENFSEELLDTLHLSFEEDYIYANAADSTVFSFRQDPFSREEFSFPKMQFLRYFETDSLFSGTAISYSNDIEHVNQLSVPFKEGKFILNSYPLAFTNYNLLNEERRAFASNCLSYLGAHENILWDEYYKVGKPGSSKTPLVEILKIPGLRWAYWLSLVTILLFIGFHSKRQQRVIPIEEKLKNSSVEYVETMGNLYYEQANFKNIAQKKIEYFKSYLFRTYNMHSIEFSEDDIRKLSSKTDKTESEIRSVIELIRSILNGEKLTVETLKTLSNEINNFYK